MVWFLTSWLESLVFHHHVINNHVLLQLFDHFNIVFFFTCSCKPTLATRWTHNLELLRTGTNMASIWFLQGRSFRQVFSVIHACSGFMPIVRTFPPTSMLYMLVSKVSPGYVWAVVLQIKVVGTPSRSPLCQSHTHSVYWNLQTYLITVYISKPQLKITHPPPYAKAMS